MKLMIPMDVPKNKHAEFEENLKRITHNTDRLFLFSCDQKIEHLNDDMYGKNIPPEVNLPQHLFSLADNTYIGAMAAHPGFISRYARSYSKISFIAKLNGKTNLVPTTSKDPMSTPLWSVADCLDLKNNGVLIGGIGITIYPGSYYEDEMLTFAAQSIIDAHRAGLIAIIWAYPRGKEISDDQDPTLIAGACGLANALGADFVKIKPPRAAKNLSELEALATAIEAAGNTKVLCAGEKRIQPEKFLTTIYNQLHEGHTAGAAIGRNIFQNTYGDAQKIIKALSHVIYKNSSLTDVLKQLKK